MSRAFDYKAEARREAAGLYQSPRSAQSPLDLRLLEGVPFMRILLGLSIMLALGAAMATKHSSAMATKRSVISANGPEADWPQWQGPDRTGIARETGLLKEWPASGPPVLWSISELGATAADPGSPCMVSGPRLACLAAVECMSPPPHAAAGRSLVVPAPSPGSRSVVELESFIGAPFTVRAPSGSAHTGV